MNVLKYIDCTRCRNFFKGYCKLEWERFPIGNCPDYANNENKTPELISLAELIIKLDSEEMEY